MRVLTRYIQGEIGMIVHPEGDYFEVDEVEEMLEGIRPPIDPRWRPMHTAPRDGTVVEGWWPHDPEYRFVSWRATATRPEWPNNGDEFTWIPINDELVYPPSAWRPAHPEWNEEVRG